MAKKSVTQAAISAPDYKPKPEARIDMANLPKGLPELDKPVSILITGKLTKIASDEYGGGLANMCVAVDSVKVQKGRKG